MATSEIETAPAGNTADPARFIVVSRHEVLAKLMDALTRGASFVALTGLPGVGKTTMAAAVRELLAARSVAALYFGRGEGGAIRLRSLAAQLLGKPEDAVDADDAERLFDIMTAHGPSGRRRVIIVDDAQLVHTEVLAYLRLLISFGIEPVPQFLFVGDPSFWHRAAVAAHANVRDLITDWVDLEPLTSAESREFAELLLGSAGPAAGAALDRTALDELVRASDGLIGRLVALLAGAAPPPDDAPREIVADPRLDDATAVASGETDNGSPSKHDGGRWAEDAVPAHDMPDPEVAAALFGAPSLGHGSARSRRAPVFASLAGVLMLAGLVGAVAYWRILVPSDHVARAEPAMIIEASSDGDHSVPLDTAASAQSAPSFEIVGSAQAAASGDLGADMRPTAPATPVAAGPGPSRRRLSRMGRSPRPHRPHRHRGGRSGGLRRRGGTKAAASPRQPRPQSLSRAVCVCVRRDRRSHDCSCRCPARKSITHSCGHASVARRGREHRYAGGSGDCPAGRRVTSQGDRGADPRRAAARHAIGFDRCGDCRCQ